MVKKTCAAIWGEEYSSSSLQEERGSWQPVPATLSAEGMTYEKRRGSKPSATLRTWTTYDEHFYNCWKTIAWEHDSIWSIKGHADLKWSRAAKITPELSLFVICRERAYKSTRWHKGEEARPQLQSNSNTRRREARRTNYVASLPCLAIITCRVGWPRANLLLSGHTWKRGGHLLKCTQICKITLHFCSTPCCIPRPCLLNCQLQ